MSRHCFQPAFGRRLPTDPVLLAPGQLRALVIGLEGFVEAFERLEAAEHRAQAAGHPAFSRKALRRWEGMSDEARTLLAVLDDASVSNLGPVR